LRRRCWGRGEKGGKGDKKTNSMLPVNRGERTPKAKDWGGKGRLGTCKEHSQFKRRRNLLQSTLRGGGETKQTNRKVVLDWGSVYVKTNQKPNKGDHARP